ncbi:hypothetical protein GCM10023206_04000 [Acinetobacter puyangensis]|uniref:Uncharacterized protein n=1 Tax=Acinetobacter puyangensis TaxID=1096779 RepID=A0A240EBS3_9GAMM|nr:hypothetical protein [Acinetobacter puyangensis]SNX46154.1 hypothetical protein SAMN05421731_108103 [Acinetobacter puyangensis]
MDFTPFKDATGSRTIDNLTLENQGERLSIYGSLQITLDQQGLHYAKQLQQLLNEMVDYLEQQTLPEKLTPPEDAEEVDNPFWQKKP